MGRPFTASDDEILRAAGAVIARRGPDAFSISEVATEVGLSRGAITLRFKSTHALKVTLLKRMVQEFTSALATLPNSASADHLLQLAAFLGRFIPDRQSLVNFFSAYSVNIQHSDLRELELERSEALAATISRLMPKVAIDHQSAVTAFAAHLTGTIMAWMAHDEEDSGSYLVARTRKWLALAGIPASDATPNAAPAQGGSQQPPERSPGRATSGSRSQRRSGRPHSRVR
jgi:AcrR family transcriptional regulator